MFGPSLNIFFCLLKAENADGCVLLLEGGSRGGERHWPETWTILEHLVEFAPAF